MRGLWRGSGCGRLGRRGRGRRSGLGGVVGRRWRWRWTFLGVGGFDGVVVVVVRLEELVFWMMSVVGGETLL